MDAVYFDLDGTLTDPKVGITRCIRHALECLGQPAPDEDELLWCIGPPLRPSLAKLAGEEKADDALRHYRKRFADIGLYENRIYPGITELLMALRGRRLFVATSKPALFAERILAHFGIAGYFERVFGSEMDGTRADKSALLAYALAETGTKPENSCMIGDRSHDMIGACANAMPAWGVLYGYGTEDELRQAGAACLFTSPNELQRRLV